MPTLKNHLQRIPFIRISGLFIAGILINHWIYTDDRWIVITLLLLLFTLILLWNNKHYQGIKIHNVLISIALFVSGIFYPAKTTKDKLPVTDKKDFYIAELCQRPILKTNSYQSVLLVKSKILTKKEKVIVYFSKHQFDTTLLAGDQMIIHASLQEIKAKANPFDFDFKAIMGNKGIYYSVFLPHGTYQKTGFRSNRLIYVAERLRDKLIAILNQTKLGQEEYGVVSALTLGYRSELDRETIDYFADTGTIHVLSVSGLHVALIYYILTLFLIPFKRGKGAVILYPLLIVICLWCYAFITGFSPSVQRSTVMFSFVIIGSLLRRPVNIYNSLMASALVLILMDPKVLFDIGFQLSYLAIFGIVLLQPSFESLISLENKILKGIWTLFTVSIAAQLITFPLSVFYFNQFPNLFWLSNFIAIPGTTVIIWLTFLFFLFSPVAFISNILADLIQFITHLVLSILKWISHVPHAVSEGIVYNPYQILLLYGLIFAFIIYVFSKNKTWLFNGLFLLILFQSSNLLTKYKLFDQRIVYQYHSKSNILHFINGRNNYILKDEKRPFDYQEIQLIKNACAHLKLHKPEVILINGRNQLTNTDIILKGNVLNFLNCQVILDKPYSFRLIGKDTLKFQQNNPTLWKRPDMHYKMLPADISHPESSFSMDFKIQFNEAVCIFIE